MLSPHINPLITRKDGDIPSTKRVTYGDLARKNSDVSAVWGQSPMIQWGYEPEENGASSNDGSRMQQVSTEQDEDIYKQTKVGMRFHGW